MPGREVLDATVDHPVFTTPANASAINSYALKRAASQRHTPSARLSRRERCQRRAHGILAGGRHADQNPPAIDRSRELERIDALERMLKRYAAAGLTSIAIAARLPRRLLLYNILKSQNRFPSAS